MLINEIQFNAELSEIIEELQRQLTLNGIPLLQKTRDVGNDIMVQCPYHGDGQERRPSAGIRKRDGQFHCFACNEKHSLPEVISHCFGHYEDLLGKFGWQWLTKNFATIEVENRDDINLDFARNLQNKQENSYITEEELDKYRYYHSYWTKRKITEERIISLFDLGYDKQTDCITMPVRDINGNTLFVARRSVKTKFFNYPKGVEKPLYGLYELKIAAYWFGQLNRTRKEQEECPRYTYPNEIIVCESMIDALTAWQYGKYAVAMNGLGTELQFKQLRELPCRKLILATDNDEAGMKARANIRKKVTNKIITEYRFPKNKKDLNDLDFSEFQALEEIF